MILDDFTSIVGEADAKHNSLVWYKDGEETFRELIKDRRYKLAVEIGTYNGVSACILASYADRVVTFDISRGPKIGQGMVYAKDNRLPVEFCLIPNDEECFLAYMEACKDADLVFVDGEHGGHFPMRDIMAALPAARIVVHDYGKTFPAVVQAVDDIAKTHGRTLTLKNEFARLDK